MIRSIALGVALFLIGYGFGQTLGPPTAAAGSVDQIVKEFQLTRKAIESIHYHMEKRCE